LSNFFTSSSSDPSIISARKLFPLPPNSHLLPSDKLDPSSEGLLLLTDDSTLLSRIRDVVDFHEVYMVKIENRMSENALRQLRYGVTVRTEDTRFVKSEEIFFKCIDAQRTPGFFTFFLKHFFKSFFKI